MRSPISIADAGLKPLIMRAEKIEFSCVHFAINYSHDDGGHFSLFWNSDGVRAIIPGRRVVKYPFMGLGEIGNVTSTFPSFPTSFWPGNVRDDVNITYIQAYTPLVKPMESSRPFSEHPYLLTLLLGKQYIKSRKHFKYIVNATEHHKDFLQLKEAIVLNLFSAKARFELVCTSRSLGDLFLVDINRLAEHIILQPVLVQVSIFLY